MIEPGLLSAIRTQVVIRELSELDEGSDKSSGSDVRPGLGQREKLDVIAQEGDIMALAEEISFANGLVGEGSIKGRGGQSHTKGQEEAGEDAKGTAHWDNPRKKYSADSGHGPSRM